VKIAVREELERFSLKANLHDSLWMIISNELFEVKGKRMEMVLPQKLTEFYALSLLVSK